MDVVDIVSREARTRVEAALPDLVAAVLPALVEAALRGDPVEDTPTPTVAVPAPVEARPDAQDRAWRTLAQGAVATVILAGTGAITQAVAVDGFDPFAWGSWSGALTGASTAILMAVLAYVQRLILPPKR
ncbi:hypothetical protein GQ85_10975 [Rhodococcus rhodochrous]|nr:hypothetical protein GQ85_10975 [Rhodococcus rhodochrous]